MSEKYCLVCSKPLNLSSEIAAGRCQHCFEKQLTTEKSPSPQLNAGEGSGKQPRQITVVFTFEWENCDDVHAELMLEDAMELKKEGVSYVVEEDPASQPEAVPVQQRGVPSDVLEWLDNAAEKHIDELKIEMPAYRDSVKDEFADGALAMYDRDQAEITSLQAQLTEARHDADVFKEWWERSEKSLSALTAKALEISKERDAFRDVLQDISNDNGPGEHILTKPVMEYLLETLKKYQKQ